MSEYEDAHMTDDNGVSWVKVEYANKMLNESSRSPGCSNAKTATERAVQVLDAHDMLEEADKLRQIHVGCDCTDCTGI